MTLRIRAVKLAVSTAEGPVGFQMNFGSGITVLRAPNNSGKSTVLQAIIYALGLEGMFSSSQSVPLPHVMTDRVDIGDRELPVVESHVILEIGNDKKEIVTLQRSVIDTAINAHLVSVWDGPLLTQSGDDFRRTDYFVRRPGSAQHELGFHTFLADFIGWDLPSVQHFDGSESLLYMETLFPLFTVEQKNGWAGVRPRIPSYYGIQDVGRRAVEFLLELTSIGRADMRAKIKEQDRQVKTEWSANIAKLEIGAQSKGGQFVGLPSGPTSWSLTTHPQIRFVVDDELVPLAEMLLRTGQQLDQLEEDNPEATNRPTQFTEQLLRQQNALAEIIGRAASFDEALMTATDELAALDRRIVSLSGDRQRLLDIRLLRSLGSQVGLQILNEEACPTCHQLLANIEAFPGEEPLSIDDNISLLDERLVTVRSMRGASERNVSLLSLAATNMKTQASQIRTQIRALKRDLVQPDREVSTAIIERRLSLERLQDDLSSLSDLLSSAIDDFRSLSERSDRLHAQLRELGAEFSEDDNRKLEALEASIRDQLRDYGFTSLSPEEVALSRTTLNPAHEGFELSFDISASDSIRTKWSFFLGLAEIAKISASNHPRLLILDEPGQQEIERQSFRSLLQHAASIANDEQQVIVATSEGKEFVENALQGMPSEIVGVDEGKLLRLLQ
jgi:predicted  nucleic acid-binding Zn-ribbon protein